MLMALTLGFGSAVAREANTPGAVAAAPEADNPDVIAAAPARPQMVEDPLGGVPADEPRLEEYSHGGYALFIAGRGWSLAVLFLIVASGLGGYMQDLAERLTRRVNLQVAIFALFLLTVTWLAGLPLEIYRGFVREKEFGFMNQSLGAWLVDRGRLFAVGLLVQVLFVVLLYVAIRRLGRRWWIAGAVIGIVFIILLQAVFPVFIAPLINDFKPLEDAALRTDILALAQSQGIPAREVYQVDASRQSEHNNAYVAGILGTQRIVIYDTMLKRFAPREIRAMVGHEMGHYVLNHMWKGIAAGIPLIAVLFFVLDRFSRRIIRRRPNLGIRGLEEPASLPVMLLVLNIGLLLALPLIGLVSRKFERDADRFTLEVVGDPAATASALIKFGRYDLAEFDVHPLIEKLLYSHPALGRRVRHAQEYARQHPGTVTAAIRPDTQAGPRSVGFLVVDGVYNSELIAPFDVLQHIRFHSPDDWPETFVVSPDGRPVRTFEGLTLTPDYSFLTAPPIDVLVVPSAEHSMDSDLENEALIAWVRETGRSARHVMSLCDGAFVLARAGLLDGIEATTFPSDQDRFEKTFPAVEMVRNVSFVDAGHALTSVGGTKSYDVAMWLVEKLYGEKVARGIGGGLVIDWNAKAIPRRIVPPPAPAAD